MGSGRKGSRSQLNHELSRKRSKPNKHSWRITSSNTTAWSGGEALIEAFGNGLAPDHPDILAAQEHRLNLPERLRGEEDWTRARGYNMSFAPAKRTGPKPTETSGGVASGARTFIGISPVSVDIFQDYPGRMQVTKLNAIVPGGVLLLNAYFRDGLDANMLEVIGGFLATCGRPWIISADWNDPPLALESSGWLSEVGGVIAAPQTATCTAGRGNVLDYFVLSERLAPFVQKMEIAIGAPTSPHHPITLTLEARAKDATFYQRVSWKPFPALPPIGCARHPRSFTWTWPPGQSLQDSSKLGRSG